nr:cobyric acid synthase [Halalkaliarchaeum desulfuricum]
MTRTILVAGTASHVGKSTVVAGLCRHLADRGFDVAPYKAQNMSNNARAVPKAKATRAPEGGGNAFGEIGISQYVQAHAARIHPTTDHNPVLLKPHAEGSSQLIVDGDAVATLAAGEYYSDYWEHALEAAKRAHERLVADHEVIVAEGAGSVGEPNLRDRDLANVETARFADADVVLVADIERGGAFASVVGTLELAPEDVTNRVAGVVISKFRGDREILEPAIDELEERTGVPVLGVLPYDDPGLPEEDSVSLPAVGERAVIGDDDGVPDDRTVRIGVPRLPRASNMTDLEPLAREPGVRVVYLPLDASLDDVDALVLSGTKNTVDDLLALREAGMVAEIDDFEGPIVGLCGGYQQLGERILNADLEGTGGESEVEGIGRLPVETRFSTDKQVEPVERTLAPTAALGGATGTVSGYEIHMGQTELGQKTAAPTDEVDRPIGPTSVSVGTVLGTYLHGLFENELARRGFLEAAFDAAGRRPPEVDDHDAGVSDPYDAAAALVATNLDLSPLNLSSAARTSREGTRS